MGLHGNGSVLLKSSAYRHAGVTAECGHAANFHSSGRAKNRRWMFNAKSSFPDGYPVPYALKIATKNGGIASQTDISGVGTINADAISAKISQATGLTGSGTVTNANLRLLEQLVELSGVVGTGTVSSAALNAVAISQATGISGSGSVTTANLTALVPMMAGLVGVASLSPSLRGIGSLSADIEIGASDPLSPEGLASAVWDTVLADHQDAGTTGAALGDASSAGNPWSALLDDNNDPGTFGDRVQKLLTVAKFLGLR